MNDLNLNAKVCFYQFTSNMLQPETNKILQSSTQVIFITNYGLGCEINSKGGCFPLNECVCIKLDAPTTKGVI